MQENGILFAKDKIDLKPEAIWILIIQAIIVWQKYGSQTRAKQRLCYNSFLEENNDLFVTS